MKRTILTVMLLGTAMSAHAEPLHKPVYNRAYDVHALGNPVMQDFEFDRQAAKLDDWFVGRYDETRRLQVALNRIKFWDGPYIEVDGIYGPQTAAAVRTVIPDIYRVNWKVLEADASLFYVEARAEREDLITAK